ncbi:MAG: nucleoside triphosphate pyrophosphohydrolase [Chloroflexi bacterium]|nr:nucleoside triphosphate pyrophosphohydrolase [Chloroflexota bacterium]
MPYLTIVGLGPGDPQALTLEARSLLQAAGEVYVRTRQHPGLAALDETVRLRSFDYLYQRSRALADVYTRIVKRILQLAERPAGVVYAVPGHPLVGEESVRRVLSVARERGIPVRIVAGLSFLEPIFTALELDPLADGLQIVDATSLAASYGSASGDRAAASPRDPFAGSYRSIDPTHPVLIAQVYNRRVAGVLKLVLLALYPADHVVKVVRSAGVPDREAVHQVPLHQIDHRTDVDHLTSIVIPPLAPLDDLTSFETLRRVVARLRAPGGCPWDREQTHGSLKPFLLEESYEVLEALDLEDDEKLAEEMGDLLLQIVLHAQLAIEADEFTLEDVLAGITTKLIRRHPHVFGDRVVADSAEVLRNWDAIKRAERGDKPASALGTAPPLLPALARSQELQRRAAKLGDNRFNLGFDLDGAMARLREAVSGLDTTRDAEAQRARLGDVLFAAVSVAQQVGLDAEEALRLANLRFITRFEAAERQV